MTTANMDKAEELVDRPEACCQLSCDGGACETCPCCSAGWCVFGIDGVPQDAEDRERWLEVAAEHNPLAAVLRAVADLADQLDEQGRRSEAEGAASDNRFLRGRAVGEHAGAYRIRLAITEADTVEVSR